MLSLSGKCTTLEWSLTDRVYKKQPDRYCRHFIYTDTQFQTPAYVAAITCSHGGASFGDLKRRKQAALTWPKIGVFTQWPTTTAVQTNLSHVINSSFHTQLVLVHTAHLYLSSALTFSLLAFGADDDVCDRNDVPSHGEQATEARLALQAACSILQCHKLMLIMSNVCLFFFFLQMALGIIFKSSPVGEYQCLFLNKPPNDHSIFSPIFFLIVAALFHPRLPFDVWNDASKNTIERGNTCDSRKAPFSSSTHRNNSHTAHTQTSIHLLTLTSALIEDISCIDAAALRH